MGHARIHVAKPMESIPKEHVGVLIDNQKDVLIFLIEESDRFDKHKSRSILCKYFGGDFLEVRVTNIFFIKC